MTDRELLEAAARSAGYIVVHLTQWGDAAVVHEPRSMSQIPFRWSPLNDDGDALRLAVKLRIEVEPWIHGDSACARAAIREILIDEPHYGDDPGRATRRCIVRAAAAIGQEKA